ncbi:MAG: hypothetical protein V1906_02395 [Candidatus Woesearchaeota archaeon]
MNSLISKLQKEHGNNFNNGILPFLQFPGEEDKYKILVVGGEHGDKVAGTNAMLYMADKLKSCPLKQTSVDMVPVLDTEGYPDKRTSFGGSFGFKRYLDSLYLADDRPDQIKALMNVLDAKKYDMALLLTESFIEEAPLLSGFFIFYQMNTTSDETSNKLNFMYPEARDLGGSILSKLNTQNIKLLDSKDGDLGDGHVIAAPGIVFQGFVENGKMVFRTRNQFAYACQDRNIPALVLVAESSSTGKLNSKESHIVSLEEAVRFYESISPKLGRL